MTRELGRLGLCALVVGAMVVPAGELSAGGPMTTPLGVLAGAPRSLFRARTIQQAGYANLELTITVTGPAGVIPNGGGQRLCAPSGSGDWLLNEGFTGAPSCPGVTVSVQVKNTGNASTGSFWSTCEIIVNGTHQPTQNHGWNDLAAGKTQGYSFHVDCDPNGPIINLQNDLGEARKTDIVLKGDSGGKTVLNPGKKNSASSEASLFWKTSCANVGP